MKHGPAAGCLVAIGCCGIAHGDFSGPYAPENWTFIAGPGGVLLQHSAESLTITGGGGGHAGNTDMTTMVMADGPWSFEWIYVCLNGESGFDNAYYLLNGVETFIASSSFFGAPEVGSLTVNMKTGDVIGFRVETVDGVFGPGILTITSFSAPVPAPAASLLLFGFGLPRPRQRQGDSA